MLLPIIAPAQGIVRSGLQCWLDANNAASYPGSGQSWTDLINGYVFYLGATSGAEASDPTFTAGSPAYFAFDGGDYFKQSAAYSGSIMSTLGRTDVAFTIEAWLYRGATANTDEGLFSSVDSGTDNGLQIYVDGGSNVPQVTPRPLGSNGTGSAQVAVGAWKHFAVTGKPDGATTGTFYTNAIANGTWSLNNSSYTVGDATRIPVFCSEVANGGSGRFQSGSRLSIIRIYNRVLSADEIVKNFNVERGRFGV